MATSERHLATSSCKAVPGRCYNRNRPHFPAHRPSSLSLVILTMLAAMATSGLALTSESTTLPSVDVEEVTTVNPPQQPANEADLQPTPPTVVAANETNVRLEPEETVAAEVADEFVHTSFVSLVGEGLEQGIRDAVKSEVESEIEADSSVLMEHKESEHKTASTKDEHTDAAQGVREPKTLEADEEVKPEQIGEAERPEEPIKVENSNKAENSETVEEPVKVEEPIKVEEPEKVEAPEKSEELHKAEDAEEPVNSKVVEEQENTEKDAVVNNVQAKPDAAEDSTSAGSEQVEEKRPLPSVTSDLVAVIFDENRAITEQPITNTNLLALEREHERVREVQTTPQPTFEVPKHQVTKKQGVEDLLPIKLPKENAQQQEESQPEPEVEVLQAQEQEAAEKSREQNAVESTSEASGQVHLNEIEGNIIENKEKESEVQLPASSTAEPDRVEPTESYVHVAEPVEETVVEPSEPVQTEVEEAVTPTEANKEQSDTAEVKPDVEESNGAAVAANSAVTVPPSEPSTTASPVEKDDESVEDDSRDESEADKRDSETQTELSAADPADKDSSEESDELSADEPKARAEDSTATPLVSYPPHNAGQTFDSNLADERSAHLSRTFTDRSTLIIALCSGTAVLFIVISLVIFVFSFQRQHGTLDIEMQEQRLGKDDLDQEDAQMKLLDVELSAPVIIAIGNEETDECL